MGNIPFLSQFVIQDWEPVVPRWLIKDNLYLILLIAHARVVGASSHNLDYTRGRYFTDDVEQGRYAPRTVTIVYQPEPLSLPGGSHIGTDLTLKWAPAQQST